MAYVKYFNTITNARGDSLPNYRAQVADSTGATVDIYADKSGTRFTNAAGEVVNYAVADLSGKVQYYYEPANSLVLQVLDPTGVLVDSIGDFADAFVLENFGGAISQDQVTDLTSDLAEKDAAIAAKADASATATALAAKADAAATTAALATKADATATAASLAAKVATTTLASDDGSLPGYQQDGAGSVAQKAKDKLDQTLSIFDKLSKTMQVKVALFTATEADAAEVTAAVQAAIDQASTQVGRTVFAPNGLYPLSGGIGISESVAVVGEGKFGTRFVQYDLDAFTFYLNKSGSVCFNPSIRNLFITYASQGTGSGGFGGIAIGINSCFYANISDVHISNAYIGIKAFNGSNSCDIVDTLVTDSALIGIHVEGCENVSAYRTSILNGNNTQCSLGCLRLENLAQGCNFDSVYTFQGAYPLTTAGTYIDGQRPAYNKFSKCYFDACADGVLIDKAVEFDFDDCWFSNGRGNAKSGIYLAQRDGIRLTGGNAINCGANGAQISADAKGVVINAFTTRNNGVDAANTYDGIKIDGGATDFTIVNCTATNRAISAFGTQRYGISIGAGCDYYTVENNQVRGNGTGGILDNSTPTDGQIVNNVGYKTKAKGIAIVPSGATSLVITPDVAADFTMADVHADNLGDDPERWWPQKVATGQFKIQLGSPAAANRSFSWSVRIKGA